MPWMPLWSVPGAAALTISRMIRPDIPAGPTGPQN